MTNRAPTISGNPPTSVIVNDPYTFAPQASDADGDPVVFRIENLPAWAAFDSLTGTISGTPSMGDIGTYSGIVISVSDGQQSAALPAFDVDVIQVGGSSTTLTWTAPTRNNDGTTLTDLAGYVIYYGTSSRIYTSEIRIENPGITTYVVDGLSAGTYYFAAKAFNVAGVESDYSVEAVTTVTGS